VHSSDKVYQLLAHGRWFSLGTPASSTTKTGWAKKKYICVYCHMSKKSRVGRHYFFFFLTIGKTGNSHSGIRFRYFIFEISGKPSFVLWRVTQFFYLLCSLFRQKASGWINKTLLLIKQQKWLSEFCVKIDRVVSKN
jgi:hypothetical protein